MQTGAFHEHPPCYLYCLHFFPVPRIVSRPNGCGVPSRRGLNKGLDVWPLFCHFVSIKQRIFLDFVFILLKFSPLVTIVFLLFA